MKNSTQINSCSTVRGCKLQMRRALATLTRRYPALSIILVSLSPFVWFSFACQPATLTCNSEHDRHDRRHKQTKNNKPSQSVFTLLSFFHHFATRSLFHSSLIHHYSDQHCWNQQQEILGVGILASSGYKEHNLVNFHEVTQNKLSTKIW